MAQHGKHYSSNRSRRSARKVDDATVGSHVQRRTADERNSSQPKPVSYVTARVGARSTENQVETIVPSTRSGEDVAAYRRRSQQRRYVESMQRKARVRRALTAILAVIVVVGIALGAGFVAFRGAVGSQMSLRDSNAAEALSKPEEGGVVYTLVAIELGEVAQPLSQEGPDMILLARENREKGTLELISIPASLKVTVDNDTRRLADMADAGDASFISAVESYTKDDVHHFLKIGKDGMAAIVDALGGIQVTFDQVVDDPNAGDVYFPLGTYDLNGSGALTYLRANNLRMGKTDQMNNQAAFAKLILERIASTERTFAQELESIGDYVQTDLSLSDLEGFLAWVKEIGPDAVTCEMVPGYFTVSSDVVGDNDELFVSKPAEFAQLVGEQADADDDSEQADVDAAQTTSVAANSFTIEVINGTDIVGAAKTTAEALADQGFRIADVGNAEQQVYDETLVIYHTRNTPAKVAEPVLDEEGNVIDEGYYEDPYADTTQQDTGVTGQTSQEEQDAAERAIGESRANAVINALGIGRVIEGDMYYSFNADVLVVIGYDYKPVA